MIGCVTLAVLLHVTVGLVAISLTYLALERLARRRRLLAQAAASLVVMVAALAAVRPAQLRLRPTSASHRAAKVSRGRSAVTQVDARVERDHQQAQRAEADERCP